VENLGKEITELIEAYGQVRSADFDRLRKMYSASPIEIAGEIDRVLKGDSRLADKHELACEVAARARSSKGESLSWLNDYRDRAVALDWKREDLIEIVAGERSSISEPPGQSSLSTASEIVTDRRSAMPIPGDSAEGARQHPESGPTEDEDGSGTGGRPGSLREPGRWSEAGDGNDRLPSEPEDDEFPIKQMIAGTVTLLIVIVLVAAVILGNDSSRVNPAEQSAWQRAEKSGSAQSYRTFVEQWPNSDRIELARDRLASLAARETAAREAATREQRARTRQAQRYLSILGYDVEASGDLDNATREAISALEDRRGLPRRGIVDAGFLRELETAWRAAEDEIWRQAQAADTDEAFMRYLEA